MMNNGIGVIISNGTLRYTDNQSPIISGLKMTIPKGKWTAILGRSGCGKTSILRYLAGLLKNKVEWSGDIHIDGTESIEGKIAYMAQQDLLMPWLNVIDNVCFASKFSEDRKEDKNRAFELLELVGLKGYERSMPSQLSGGMRQRVALARTLMQDKPLVLMDEPFSALDAVTRYRLQNLAAQVLVDKTVLLITHDPQEALRLSDRVYIMKGQPASTISLTVSNTPIPRKINAELAVLQQQIIDSLEVDYV
nr:ABC transporter ATP-binding protein [Aliivibrio fischeri]